MANEGSNHKSGSDSSECVDIVLDVEMDMTVRPIRPELRKQAEAERDRIKKWTKNGGHELKLKQEPESDRSDGTGPK
ncbi:MAG: hypothetical protein U0793_25585 [Gemmataceae bacterium]